jgi:hypothetical protein
MFCRLIARLFTKSKARQDQRHLDARKETLCVREVAA